MLRCAVCALLSCMQELGSITMTPPPATHLEFTSLEVAGFGPFLEPTLYPLDGRGVTVISGDNRDDDSSQSNGAGKTSLVSALLWAFRVRGDKARMLRAAVGGRRVLPHTRVAVLRRLPAGLGRHLSRAPTQTHVATHPLNHPTPVLLLPIGWGLQVDDSRNLNMAQVIHEDAKKARVVVRGVLNGSHPFTLERTATAKKSSLSIQVGGEDLTQQEQRLTDAVLRDQFSAALLPKTLFFGQEQLMELILVSKPGAGGADCCLSDNRTSHAAECMSSACKDMCRWTL